MARSTDAKVKLAGLWIAAAAVGLLAAAIPALSEDAPARLIAAVLLVVSVPFGLLRPSVPALWAVAIGWPTVITRLSQDAGGGSVLLLAYPLVGVYGGDWVATWWSERYGRGRPPDRSAPAPPGAGPGGGAAPDGLPPAIPGRWAGARRRAEEEGRQGAAVQEPGRDPGPEPENLPGQVRSRFRR